MKWQAVLWWASMCLTGIVCGVPRHYYSPVSEMSCLEYPTLNHNNIDGMYNEEWRPQRNMIKYLAKRSLQPFQFEFENQTPFERTTHIVHNIIPRTDSLLEEHAKLVQDINSLRQVVFIPPFVEDSKDYDESIYHEIIETTSTTSRPSLGLQVSSTRSPVISTRIPYIVPSKPAMSVTKMSSIPIILLGGASQRQVVKSQPITFAKPTVSLVGTTISPLIKHPYPFVMQTTSRKPYKICMTTLSSYAAKRPSLWDRLRDFFVPSGSLGR